MNPSFQPSWGNNLANPWNYILYFYAVGGLPVPFPPQFFHHGPIFDLQSLEEGLVNYSFLMRGAEMITSYDKFFKDRFRSLRWDIGSLQEPF